MQREGRFWDRHAERYARRPVGDEDAYRRKLEITRSYFRPDMKVLELGCGTGSTAIEHAPHVKSILAVDFSEKMLAIARRKAEAAGIDNIGFEQSGVGAFDAADGAFDAVLALNLLHLLDDWRLAIAKIHGLLVPGGVFVSSTVCIRDALPWIRFVAPIGRFLGLLPTLAIFRREDLVDALKQAGFAIEHEWQPEGRQAALFIVARKAG